MIPTNAEIVRQLAQQMRGRPAHQHTFEKACPGCVQTAHDLLPVVKALILGARIGALEVVLSAPDVTLRSTLELELNHYRCELVALERRDKCQVNKR